MQLRALALGLAVSASLLQAAPATAQATYPSRPVTLVVPQAAGGTNDIVGRLVGQKLGEVINASVVVDNRPGAGGNVGLSLVAKSPADGYTLGLGAAGGLSANVSLYAQMPFDPVKDFKPVGMVAAIPFVLIGHPSTAARNLSELIAQARREPGKLSIGHGGNGTAMHLSTALLGQMADARFVEVPYRGSGPAALDTLGGQIPLAIVDLPSALQQIKAGKLIAYAVTSPQRLPMLPEVPTMAEAGLPGYDSTGWFGLVAPAGTPDAIVSRLNTELNAALSDPQIQVAMRNLGVEPSPGTPAAFGAYIASETTKWAKVIQAARIKLD